MPAQERTPESDRVEAVSCGNSAETTISASHVPLTVSSSVFGIGESANTKPARLGDFRIIREIGRGGMGVVFEAEDEKLQRRVALKVLALHAASNPLANARFLREARIAAALTHDHIVPVYHVGQDSDQLFIVMPLLTGETLESRIRRESSVPPTEVVRFGREAALGLANAHAAGLIHRDIKPANIWLEPNGRLKILDFGLARTVGGPDGITGDGAILGTLGYMAPEQAEGQTIDRRADLFSLGATLYRCATGKPAFKGATNLMLLRAVAEHHPMPPHEINPAIPVPLSNVIMRLLSKSPADRPQQAQQVADELASLETASSVAATSTWTGPRVGLLPQHRRKLQIGCSVTISLCTVIGVIAMNLWSPRIKSQYAGDPVSNVAEKPRNTQRPGPPPLRKFIVKDFIAITTARRTVIAIDVIFRNVDASDDPDMKARLVDASEKMLREFVVNTLHAPHIPRVVEVVSGFGSVELMPIFLATKHVIAPLGKAGQFHGKYLVFRGEALKLAQKTADEKLKRYRVRFVSPQACKDAVAKLQEEAKDEESTTIRYLMEVEGILLLAKQGITDDALAALDSLYERFHLNRPEMTVQIFDALLTAYGAGQRKRLMPELRKAITRLQDQQPPAEREVIRLLEIGLEICLDDLTIPFESRVEFQNDLQRVAFPYGQKLCFDLGNWNDGLRYLVYCKDANLIQLVRKDKERPTELKAFMNLGDLWGSWTKGAALSPQRKIACFRRAIYWYDRLLEAKLNTPDESIAKNEKSKLLREIEKIENVQTIMGFAISWMSTQ